MRRYTHTKKGFTMIELMFVIAIIAIMSAVVLGSVNSARTKARDQARKDTLVQLKTAIEAYKDKYGSYPNSGGCGASQCWYSSYPGGLWYMNNGPGNNGNWIPQNTPGLPQLVPEFISKLPLDPAPNNSPCSPSNGNPYRGSYMYVSDGAHYLVASHCASETGYKIDDPYAMNSARAGYMWILCNDRTSCAW